MSMMASNNTLNLSQIWDTNQLLMFGGYHKLKEFFYT